MQLSYTCRLLCLALCSAGVLQLLMEFLSWLAAPLVIAHASYSNARRAEGSVFLLALLARLGPWLVALGAWLPAYVRGEDNLLRERVGWFCVVAAILVAAWSVVCSLRVAQAWFSTRRCCRQCQPAGTVLDGLPLLLYPGDEPLLAVAGLFRPRIVVSQALLTPGRLKPETLDVALLHEGAHVRHRDNLKLAVLTLLPHVPFASQKHPSLDQHWRLAAELAADEEGAKGGQERSILLAELLVTLARKSRQAMPRGSFALLSRPEDLRIRVERLLQQPSVDFGCVRATAAERSSVYARCALALGSVLLGALCYLGTELGHGIAEVIFHIG